MRVLLVSEPVWDIAPALVPGQGSEPYVIERPVLVACRFVRGAAQAAKPRSAAATS